MKLKRWLTVAFTVLCSLGGTGLGQEQTGYIQILGDPGTRVLLDGSPVGETNQDDQGLVIPSVDAGVYRLRFERSGFKPLSVKLRVAPGAITVYTLNTFSPEATIDAPETGEEGFLEARTGKVQIACLPVRCIVSIPELGIEDYVKGSGPLTIADILATSYQVDIQTSRGRLRKTVSIAPDATLELFADFTGRRPKLEQTVVEDPIMPTEPRFEATLEQPLAVLIDNADAAYPQQGLVEASSVFEMPVENGLTGLMSVYTRDDPAQVGPIRSARDYFLEAALGLNGTLVHVGGAPSTVSRILSQVLPTIDALQQPVLFAQAPDRLAPFRTFSTGTALRDAVGRHASQVSGTLYAPPTTAPNAKIVSVTFSANYSSGFRYLNDLDLYRWVRDAFDAADTAGTAITTDAVVVARVTAFAYPDDPEGRLYLPYSGGAATLYLRGKAVAGSWTSARGFTFLTASGGEVDLTPFKHWILFAPEDAELIGG